MQGLYDTQKDRANSYQATSAPFASNSTSNGILTSSFYSTDVEHRSSSRKYERQYFFIIKRPFVTAGEVTSNWERLHSTTYRPLHVDTQLSCRRRFSFIEKMSLDTMYSFDRASVMRLFFC